MTDSADKSLSTDERNWQSVLRHLRGKLSSQQFETWFVPLGAQACGRKQLHLVAPNRFYADWLLDHYGELLTSAAATVTGSKPVLLIDVVPKIEKGSVPEPARAADSDEQRPSGPALNSRLTFQRFVIGPSNRLAHAAALAVAEEPGATYNPVFIHGGCGLGKTHLLQAVCHRLYERDPKAKILYLSCEAFVTDFIGALEKKRVESFRARYRNADALVVDDIHFLANKERSQEEFFHTFNALYSRTRQVILSSDRAPSEIPTLTERLVSRFKWGLITRLDPPSYETRLAIIKQKAHDRGLTIGDDVAAYVAEHVSSNVRELEGATIRLVGYASLSGRPLDLTLAEEILTKPRTETGGPGITAIQNSVATAYQVKRRDLLGKRRPRSIAYPRQVAMYLARKLTSKSLEEIGKSFGGRDHSTVLHACDKISKELVDNPQLRDLVEHISDQLQHQVQTPP